MLTHDTQRAYLIPDDSREAYFKMIDDFVEATGRIGNDGVDPRRDPIVIFDLEFISHKNWEVMERRLKAMGAKNITETVEMELATGPKS